jgi:hypothetical protein
MKIRNRLTKLLQVFHEAALFGVGVLPIFESTLNIV